MTYTLTIKFVPDAYGSCSSTTFHQTEEMAVNYLLKVIKEYHSYIHEDEIIGENGVLMAKYEIKPPFTNSPKVLAKPPDM